MTYSIEYKAVKDLQPGDLVDLQGDPYADPYGDIPAFEFEFQIVDSIELETPTCTVVHFEGLPQNGFPADHKVKVKVYV